MPTPEQTAISEDGQIPVTDTDVNDLLHFAEKLADCSRALLLEASRSERAVQVKQDASLVTETDLLIEARMRAMIEVAYPHHGVLGEEHGTRNLDSEYVWVLDPIDGTAAFVAGIPVYGTLIGLAREGRPYLGVIDHPATDERWVGVAGRMARLNGNSVQVRSCESVSRAFLTNSNPDFLTEDEGKRFNSVKSRALYTQYGGSCYSYAMLATGRTDLAIDSGLDPFDVFAPAAVIEGAGGRVMDWSGAPLSLAWTGQVIAAGDAKCLAEARELLCGQA